MLRFNDQKVMAFKTRQNLNSLFWKKKAVVHFNTFLCVLQGKVFPKLKKRSSAARLIDQDGNGEEQTAADYVFRIVYPGYRHDASE